MLQFLDYQESWIF